MSEPPWTELVAGLEEARDTRTTADVKSARRLRMTLPHGETDPRKTYSMPDPDALAEAYGRARQRAWPPGTMQHGPRDDDEVMVSAGDLRRVLDLARGYLDLTTHALGQERCVGKLRDIWRARRASTGAGE